MPSPSPKGLVAVSPFKNVSMRNNVVNVPLNSLPIVS